MDSLEKANALLTAYEKLDWSMYIDICDRYLKIEPQDITSELTKQSIQYSYYAGLLVIAQEKLEQAQIEVETYLADAKSIARDDLVTNKKKVTDKAVESMVLSSNKYKELLEEKVRVETKYNLLKSLVRSMEHRRDCLIQLSSNHRAESKIYN